MNIAQAIANYACSLEYGDLSANASTKVKQRLIDSLACILGAYHAPPVRAALAYAATVPADAASIFGLKLRTTADIAAFANGAMVRYLDYNDGFMSLEPGHPSDNITACLAVAEAEGASGRDLILAIVIAYEVQMRLQQAAGLNKRGWDHVNYVLISAAAGVSRLLRLTPDQTTQAINMAVNSHIALRQVRSGELSSWKGCSAANAARNAIFCAQLARHGMTGPSPIFEGKMGFINQVSGELALDVGAFARTASSQFMIERSGTKRFPTNGEQQTAVLAALDIRPRLPSSDEIASIHIGTTDIGHRILASDPEKWRPSTRETADHSLPYTVSRALLDGNITLDSYSQPKILAPDVVELMQKVTVEVDPEVAAQFPRLGNRVTVKLKSGEVLTRLVLTGADVGRGAMTDEDFEAKFRDMASPHLDRSAQDAVLTFVGALEEQRAFKPLFDGMISQSPVT